MKPLSIGVFTYSTLPRGSVVHAAALTEALRQEGHEATLYALNKGRSGFYRSLRCPIELIPTGSQPASTGELVAQRAAELSQHLRAKRQQELRHDVYHAQDCLSANGLLQVEGVSARLVRTVHHVERFSDPYLDACQRRSILAAARLVTVSRQTQEEVLEEFGRRTGVVGNGVENSRFVAACAGNVARIRAELLKGGGGPLLLSVGGIEERKNALQLLRAFVLLRKNYPEAVWAIVGGSSVLDHTEYQKAFAAELKKHPGVEKNIRFLGLTKEAELSALFCAADVLGSPSKLEGYGLCVLEACAVGLPTVVSNRPPFTEYLDAASTALVDPEEPVSIAAGLHEQIKAPLRCQSAAHRVALAHNWRAVARRHLHVYRGLVRHAPRPERETPATTQEPTSHA